MDVIAMARQLGKALQQDEGYLRLMVAQQQNDADETLQTLIGKFNLARINLNTELNKTDKDQARVTALNEEVRAVYGQIMDNENMAAYNKAKTEFDDTVDSARKHQRRGPGSDREAVRLLGKLFVVFRLQLIRFKDYETAGSVLPAVKMSLEVAQDED